MSTRTGYCLVSISPVRSEKRDASEMVTQLLFGELVTIEEHSPPWCKIVTYADNYSGFVDSKHIRFLSEKEANRWMDGLGFEKHIQRLIQTPWGKQTIHRGSFVPFDQKTIFNIGNDQFSFLEQQDDLKFSSMVALAEEYINTPYLWGGKTPVGIDCSGLTQLIFRFFDINLPRDASQQIDHGQPIEFGDHEPGDLAFFHNSNGKIIHVGILDGRGGIMHASGMVRKDLFTNDGIVHIETGQLTHHLHSIKRM